jgi:hypothetical protein
MKLTFLSLFLSLFLFLLFAYITMDEQIRVEEEAAYIVFQGMCKRQEVLCVAR